MTFEQLIESASLGPQGPETASEWAAALRSGLAELAAECNRLAGESPGTVAAPNPDWWEALSTAQDRHAAACDALSFAGVLTSANPD